METQDKLIFLTFTTKWCGDCKMMKPVIQRLSEKYQNKKNVTFIEVDAEEAKLFREVDNKWNVLRVPTFILLKGQEIVEKGYEYIPEEILSNWIDKKI
ncbi:thioredoxin family protein [Mycoplasma sp. NEAQ87857]|uniref:thioredoxin family protein n=1 Tax=Mycoplasma sp. NEAQ87857 TaxID=2683967 RepID=UPI0021073B6A|nr:thioredoxin family protein [Mycoplasma sp. NEAQ87857]